MEMATFSGSSVLATVGGDSFPNLNGFKTVTKHPVSVCLATGIGIGRGSYCSRRFIISSTSNIKSSNNIIIMAAETEKLGIKIVKNPPESKLSDLGVRSWPNKKDSFRNIAAENRWDSLKKEWGIWKRLLRGESGLGWNNEKGTIEATPDWWQRKIQEVPDAAKYREKGPILLEDQEMLFSDVVATGASAWTPSSGILPPHLLDELDESSDVQFHNFNDHVNEPNAETDATTNTQAESGPIGGNRRGSAEFSTRIRGKKIKKMSNGDKIVRCLERMVGTLETDSSLSNSSKEHGQQYSIKDCLDILEEMSGIEEGDTMWMYATRLFLKPSVREMFLAIKKNETRLRWLQDQMERDMQRRPSSTTSAHASRGVSDNDIASS
ncbi:hypothetical protein BUALT_Bualt08G0151000 [Buddleja alternifolia]|uniref:Myb/SANT-like domain-containing protein n=1 Tax=Buddleja alternifolia TaxID=168488 RepID=A0AAV6XEP8_9LAMI|nr:hypothetical protein BUALT_Bualt08G0151000 [Buddleja alternifolia]